MQRKFVHLFVRYTTVNGPKLCNIFAAFVHYIFLNYDNMTPYIAPILTGTNSIQNDFDDFHDFLDDNDMTHFEIPREDDDIENLYS